jgi:hypothetical protein
MGKRRHNALSTPLADSEPLLLLFYAEEKQQRERWRKGGSQRGQEEG